MSLLQLQLEGRGLTTRELEVLRAAAEGLSAKETGKTLCKSEHTIATQRRALQAKLGAKNLTHAIALAYQRGIL
ncbi:MAG: helix-turn-helix transcriptional regulator [Gaiellaceae bacterium]